MELETIIRREATVYSLGLVQNAESKLYLLFMQILQTQVKNREYRKRGQCVWRETETGRKTDRQRHRERYVKENGWEDNRTNRNGRNCAQRVLGGKNGGNQRVDIKKMTCT